MITRRHSLILAAAVLATVATAGTAGAATATWTRGAGTNNWNTAGNWDCGCVPGTGGNVGMDVVIGAGAGTVTINAGLGALSLGKLTISGGTVNGSAATVTTTGTIDVQGGSLNPGSGAFTVGGTCTVSGGTWSFAGASATLGCAMGMSASSGTFTGNSGAITVTGNLTMTGTATVHTSTTTTTITGDVSQGSTGTLDLNGANSINGNLTQTANGAVTPASGGSVTVGTVGTPKTLQISAGSFTGNAGNITVNGDLTVDGSGAFTGPSGSSTLSVTGNVSYSSSGALNLRSGASPTITVTGSFTQSSGAGTLTGPGAGGSLTIGTVGTPKNLTISAGSFNGSGGTITVNGNVSLSSSAGFQGSSTTTSITGDVSHTSSGTLSCNGGTTNVTGAWTQSAGTTTVGGGALTVGTAMVPKNVAVSGGSFNGAGGAITITGDLTLTSTGAFQGSTATTTVGGNVSHGSSGTLDCNGGTTSVTGSWTQSAGTTTVGSHALTVGVVMVPTNVNLSGGAFNGAAGAITVTGNLALSGTGAFQAANTSTTVGGNLSLAGSSSYTRNGTGTLSVGGTVSESGGTFTGGSGLITIGGDLGPLSGGTFTAGSGTMKISGKFNRTSASNTYVGNNGTMLFVATSAQTHTFTGAAVGEVIFNDGLVGYWALDEGTASHPDSGGYANDASLTGTYSAASTRPSVAFADTAAIALDGTTNYLTLGTTSLPAANAAQTISVWVNFGSAASTQTIVAMTAAGSAIKFGLGGGNLRVLRNDSTVLAQVAAPSASAWHHVAYVYDPTQAGANKDKLYVDGTATTGTNTAHDSATPTAGFMGATAAATDLFNGSLDEVRVYARALASRDITDLAFGHLPATGSVTHTLSDALDTSGAANNGNLRISSGVVAGTSALNVTGSWLNYGGRFTGTGLVTLASGASRSLLSGGERFPNLTISATGKYTLLDRLWVPGTLSLSGPTLSFNDGGYVFHAGTLVTPTATAYQVSTGTAIIDGRSNQTITAQNFNSLRIEAPNETGLAGYWKLDEGQETTARDVSGSGNDGALSSSGVSWASAAEGITFDNAAAASFDGTSGYVSAGATGFPAANAAQTVGAWVKFASAASTQTLVAMTASGSAIKLGLGGGNVRALRSDGTVLAQVVAPSTGTWHHIAYVYDPTASGANRDKIYVDGTVSTGTNVSHDGASPTATFIGASSAAADFFSGQLDDVRVYTQSLTAAQVASLYAGRYAGTGISTTVTAGHNISVASSGIGIFIDSGVLYSSTFTITTSATGSPGLVNSGTLHIGSNVVNYDGGLTINPMGTLLMDESGGQFQPGVDSTVTINGTLTASNTGALIQRDGSGQRFRLRVGTTSTATPTLNITGLSVRDVYAEGMFINYDPGATTTVTRFDNVVFSRGVAGAGAQFLQAYGASFYMTSNGCSFGVGQGAAALPASAVTLTGNGTADGETRAMFGAATCAASKTDGTTGLCVTSWKTDDDADGNGVGNTPATNGAVIQFIRGAGTDMAGSIEGFPTAAFDWSTFAYYSTYATFHDASGTADIIYVRGQTGGAKNGDANYKWTTPSGETIVGTPRWTTSGGTHLLYVALASGKVYRLVDNGSTLIPDSTGNWTGANNPFDCACTIVSPLILDTNNLYWGGTTAGPVQKVWTLGQTSRSQPMGSPFTIGPVVTSASPALWTSGATSYLFIGLVGNVIKLNVTNQTLDSTNSNPGSASVRGRVAATTSTVYAGDDGGTMWAISPTNFTGTNKLWSYVVASDSIQSSPIYEYATGTVHFGTDGGKVVALNASGTALTGYPYVPGLTSDSIRSALLYTGGILVVGSTTGKLFFIDRNNGTTGPALVRQYYFGPTEQVSGVGYDSNVNRYMIATADPTTKDGRLYYVDLIADPTPATP